MKTKINILLVFLALCSFGLQAQQGKLIGTVKDSDDNEPLAFATVFVTEVNKGASTDFDGKYELSLDPGVYSIKTTFMGYTDQVITDIVIKKDEITTININLVSNTKKLDAVVISAKKIENTESSILAMQKKSVNTLDGISSQNLKQMGAGDVASAVKSVPGVSIQGGKYVFVRGLGDRYTKSILNGVDIPGLDPDRNTIQMDIFPSSILDNIIVVKSFSADLPADFTGGIVNIVTKDYPERQASSISVSGTFNPSMHFNDNYRSYNGSSTDALGFDSGDRDLPVDPNQAIPYTFDNDANLTALSKNLNPSLSALQSTSGMDYSLRYTTGNQLKVGEAKNKLGYITSLSYKKEFDLFEDAENNVYYRDPNTANSEMLLSKSQKGDLGISTVTLSGLGGLTYKTQHSKYRFNVLHIQNGESGAGLFEQVNNESDFITLKKDNLTYTERAITNFLISGANYSKDASWSSEWKLSPTFSSIDDKDMRTTAFRFEEGVYSISPNSEPRRIWRNLDEQNYVGKIDFTKSYDKMNVLSKVKFGGQGSRKIRDYDIFTYQIGFNGPTTIFEGNANSILAEENLWTVENQQGTFLRNTSIVDPANVFTSTQTNIAGYLSGEFNLGSLLKAVAGVRMENYMLHYTGQNSTETEVYNNENIINAMDFFPALNMIYTVNENTNLRMSASRTTVRPSFKEASIAQIYDPLSNLTFIGNIDLKPTYINNLDVRYEVYGNQAQMIAFSGFYKDFTDPIEMTYYKSSPNDFTPNNLAAATVYGVEFEARKNLSFISSTLDKFKFNVNASLINSSIEMGEDEITLRTNTARVGETIETTRSLQGQSPYLVNAGINYKDIEKQLQFGVFFNVQGKTLEVVGGRNPDVYAMPFHSLNTTMSKSIGEKRNSNISVKVSNILASSRVSHYQAFNSEDQIFSLRTPGTELTLGYSYKF